MHVLPRYLKREELSSNVFVMHVQFRDWGLAVLCWQVSSQAHFQISTSQPQFFSQCREEGKEIKHRFSLPKSKRSKTTFDSLIGMEVYHRWWGVPARRQKLFAWEKSKLNTATTCFPVMLNASSKLSTQETFSYLFLESKTWSQD